MLLDTDVISGAQLLWLTAELERSQATWKIVYGHHPIYSEGQHEDNNVKIEQLLPVLRSRADVYLAGHDHDMQHLNPEGRLHFFIAGSGGKLRTIEPGPRSLFARSANGFAVIEADARTLTVTFVEPDLTAPYTYTISSTAGSPRRRASGVLRSSARPRACCAAGPSGMGANSPVLVAAMRQGGHAARELSALVGVSRRTIARWRECLRNGCETAAPT